MSVRDILAHGPRRILSAVPIDQYREDGENYGMVQFDPSRLAEICRRHGVMQLRLFGSAAREEDTVASDIDLIADFAGPTGFFGLIRCEDELARFFGRPVDLLTEGGLSPYLRDDVLAEARVIFDDAA